MNKPLCLGVTGGIGSGKSYVCRMLEQRGVPVFYTDDEAKLEMRSNTAIHQELCAIIGPEVLDACGRPVKDVLSQYIRQSTAHAQRGKRHCAPTSKGASHALAQQHASQFHHGH